jgi:NTE family protein
VEEDSTRRVVSDRFFAAEEHSAQGGHAFDNSSGSNDLMVGLAFSGGGTRAAAFSFGVLSEIERTPLGRAGAGSLLDRVNFVSGVSGGSVLTAYYGLKKRAALADFRECFLLRNAEEPLTTGVSPLSIVLAVAGGVNDSSQFARWLNDNLFEGATFGDMRRTPGPEVWINASDIYNRTTFVFGRAAFAALCSDLASYPIADAVAASAAVPVVFAPAIIKSYRRNVQISLRSGLSACSATQTRCRC